MIAAAAIAAWLNSQSCERVQIQLERQVHAKAAGKPSRAARASVERVCVAGAEGK